MSEDDRQVFPIQPSEVIDDAGRPVCAGCGEPVELASPDDPDSWIHAADANYFGDHTAWLEDELS